jgi:hypothetical protein
LSKYIGKDDCKFRSIEDSPKCGINIIAMLKNISNWKCNAKSPEVAQVTKESSHIVHWRAHIRIITLRTGDECVGGALSVSPVWPIHTIDADSALAFPYSPLNRVDYWTKYKVEKKLWQVNMKPFFFFFCKLCFDVQKTAMAG